MTPHAQPLLGALLSRQLTLHRALARWREQLLDSVLARKLAELGLAPQREDGVVPGARRVDRRFERIEAHAGVRAWGVLGEEAGQARGEEAGEGDEFGHCAVWVCLVVVGGGVW